jgi:hypothetical protein
MTIAITYIRLRSLWHFFQLSWHGLLIMRQAKALSGNKGFQNTGFGYKHYTLTAWSDEEAMRQFAYSDGAHKEAMKSSRKIAREIKTYTYQADAMPEWKVAKQLVEEKGKVFRILD